MSFIIECPESVVAQEIEMRCTRESLALTYALCLRRSQDHGLPVKWGEINGLILTRFKPSGLAFIKALAWDYYTGKKNPPATVPA